MLKNFIYNMKMSNLIQNNLYLDFLLKKIFNYFLIIFFNIFLFFLEKYMMDYLPKNFYKMMSFYKKKNFNNLFMNIIFFFNLLFMIYCL